MRVYLGICACVMGVGTAGAQDAPAPSEAPPVGYAATAFIDSQGCAFSRAEMNGGVFWVARRDAARQLICDETPTFARAGQDIVVTQPVAVSLSQAHAHGTVSQTAQSSARIPKGYRKVWGDDRLNANRGPRTAAGDAAMARVWSNKVPMVWIGN